MPRELYRALRRDDWTASYALWHDRVEAEMRDAEARGRVTVEIVPDDLYNANPGAHVAWSEADDADYVERFERGELTAYGVIVRIGNVAEASLWGVDVETGTESDQTSYLRTVARELYSELIR